MSDETPSLSVVIPVYNEGENVVPTLRGVVEHTRTRPLEVLVDVHSQGLQRRDVDDLGAVARNGSGLLGPVQAVDADEEGGQGLPRAGGGRDQRVPAGGDLHPARGLGRGRPVGEPSVEPGSDGGMEQVEHVVTVPSVADGLGARSRRARR